MYVEYTGTAYMNILKEESTNDMDKVYNTLKKYFKEKNNFEVLDQTKFNNTYTLAVTKETAKNII